MIKPTVGRIVWYHPAGSRPADRPLAAIVTHVWSDPHINLAVFESNGLEFQTSVFLFQGDGERPEHMYAEWMPYQQGQAVKAEALEKQLQGKTAEAE